MSSNLQKRMSCFPGSGCKAMDDVIEKTISGSVSTDDYVNVIDSYLVLPFNKDAVRKFKQCFLDQSEEARGNMTVMTVIIHFPPFLHYTITYLYYRNI